MLVEVAKCESQFRQYDKDGSVLRGEKNDHDVGVMQINEDYHADIASSTGEDLMTIKGNTAYARDLFEKEGLKPWSSSRSCWSKSQAYADYKKDLAINK